MTLPATLTALFIAFALTILAPTNAAAQTTMCPDNTLCLGTVNLSATSKQIHLRLIFPVTATDGKLYYFLSVNGDDQAAVGQVGSRGDSLTNSQMNELMTGDANGEITVTQEGAHDGSKDARSLFVNGGSRAGGHTLVVPTVAEFRALRTAWTSPSQTTPQTGVPTGWLGGNNVYATANAGPNSGSDNILYYPSFASDGDNDLIQDSDIDILQAGTNNSPRLVAFQVIPPENLLFKIKVFLEGAQ